MTTPSDLATKDVVVDVKADIANLRADMHRTAWVMGGGIVAATVILTRLLT